MKKEKFFSYSCSTVSISIDQARASSETPRENAFCRVAPSVRLSSLAIFLAFVFFRASDFKVRTSDDVQGRFFVTFFTISISKIMNV